MPSNLEIITAHYAASAAGDLVGMLAPLTPATRWREADGFPCAGVYVGPDAVRENVFEALGRMFDGYRLDVDEILDAGNTIVGVGTYSGTHRETGRSFRARVVHLWKLEDGAVTSFEQITDTAMVRSAMP